MGKIKNSVIGSETILQRDLQQEFTYIDGEVVMLCVRNGEYYGLDPVGTRIWEMLEKPVKFSQLVDQLMEEFDAEREICEKDTREYLVTLLEKELVKEKD